MGYSNQLAGVTLRVTRTIRTLVAEFTFPDDTTAPVPCYTSEDLITLLRITLDTPWWSVYKQGGSCD